jgi:hypothetical protein
LVLSRSSLTMLAVIVVIEIFLHPIVLGLSQNGVAAPILLLI